MSALTDTLAKSIAALGEDGLSVAMKSVGQMLIDYTVAEEAREGSMSVLLALILQEEKYLERIQRQLEHQEQILSYLYAIRAKEEALRNARRQAKRDTIVSYNRQHEREV